MITSEMYNKIQQAVEALPPRCKMIFKLVREDGLKYKEVSDILNIAVNTIDVQMAIAVKKIATALKFELDLNTARKPNPEIISSSFKKKFAFVLVDELFAVFINN